MIIIVQGTVLLETHKDIVVIHMSCPLGLSGSAVK
jgi:hypothetical protein